MSQLAFLQEQLLDTSRMISELERALAENPTELGLKLSLDSLVRRRTSLEKAFEEVADSLGQDVCSYRIIPEGAQTSVTAFSTALTTFQSLFSTVYDSLKYGKKLRARFGAEVVSETEFTFGYTFAGSIGVVFTMSNEKMLVGGTKLDEAMKIVLEMASSTDRNAIQKYSRELGVSSVRAMYRWVANNASRNLGVAVDWHRGEIAKGGALIQPVEFKRLQELLDRSGEETEEEIELVASLVGADVDRKTFHLKLDNNSDIKGVFVDAISEQQSVELPRKYKAKIRKSTKVGYSTDEEKHEYLLLALAPSE